MSDKVPVRALHFLDCFVIDTIDLVNQLFHELEQISLVSIPVIVKALV